VSPDMAELPVGKTSGSSHIDFSQHLAYTPLMIETVRAVLTNGSAR